MRASIFLGVIILSYLSTAISQTDSLPVNPAKVDNRLSMLLQSEAGVAELAKERAANAEDSENSTLYPIVVYSSDVGDARAIGIEPNSIESQLFTARATLSQIVRLSSLGSVKFITLAKKRKPLLDISVPEIRADKLQNGSFNGTSYTGKGVIFGLIDTGIDWKNLDFRSPSDATQSRILWLWDQTIIGTTHPAGYVIGEEFSQAQINAELGASPPNIVKEQDTDGHGTHVAGIAAGNGASSAAGYKGVAPDADIIAVRTTFLDNDILDGITYIQKKADAAGKPFVINLSLGSQQSAHDGTDVDEIGIDNQLQSAGRAIAIAAGNEGQDHVHCDSAVAQGGSITYNFSIPSYSPTAGPGNDDLWFDVWYKPGDQFTITVKSPNGSVVAAAPGAQTTVETPSDGHVLISNAPGGADPLDSTKDCTIEIYDAVASKAPRNGAWSLTISGTSITQGGAFDIWLDYTEISSASGDSPEFTSGYTFRKLVGSPGTSKKAITVGSYVTRGSWKSIDGNTYHIPGANAVGDYSLFSSMGPTRDGRQKPEICAPGELIVSSLSTDSTPDSAFIAADGKHVVMEGTSMSTPHIAGVLALLLQANPALTSDQLKNAITSTARKDSFTGSQASAQWGFGKVDAAAAMGTVLSVAERSRPIPNNFSLSQNFPNPFNPATVIRYQLAVNSVVTVEVYDVLWREVARLENGEQAAGSHSVQWDAASFSSGVYFCVLKAGTFHDIKKMVLMK